jgi:Tfp pilus assembly ATPase PilU
MRTTHIKSTMISIAVIDSDSVWFVELTAGLVRKSNFAPSMSLIEMLPSSGETKPVPTPALLLAMLKTSSKVSDLIMSPGSHPVVELWGTLVPVKVSGLAPLTPEDARHIAYELFAGNKQASTPADLGIMKPFLSSVRPLPVSSQRVSQTGQARNRNAHGPQAIPTLADLNLPPKLVELTDLLNDIVLVIGPAGSGKSASRCGVRTTTTAT